MRISLLLVMLFVPGFLLGQVNNNTTPTLLNDQKTPPATVPLIYHNAFDFEIMGRYHDEKNFNRIDTNCQRTVRPMVWAISKNSAGISVRFRTNSTALSIKWKLTGNASLRNMSKVGVSGVDVYCYVKNAWQFINTGIPGAVMNDASIITQMDTTTKEFLVNLPLYDGVDFVEIGIDENAKITRPKLRMDKIKPIVFYGTSITQGGSASRPGMAYPSIISRKYNVETINLGISGNGRFEQSVGEVLCNIDASLFVIDCTPNSPPDTVKKNALNLILQLRACQPQTPILLVESIYRENYLLSGQDETKAGGIKFIKAQNRELKKAFDEAKSKGIKKIYYLPGDNLIGLDHEGTVDGTHLTDLGFYRMAEEIGKSIKKIIKIK